VSVIALEAIMAFPTPAGAYTDPNLGNLVFQILFPVITVLTTGYLLCKNYLKRKLTSLRKRFKESGLKK
jgi:hypothetical protein